MPNDPATTPTTSSASSPPPSQWRMIGCRGCGSAIVEAAMALADIPYEREEVDYSKPGPERDRLLQVNPLGQVPALVLPDGSIMTESAAMVLHINDIAPGAHLVPPSGDPARKEFLRWLVFLVAAVYPTFTYGDEPERWVGADAKEKLRSSTNAHRQALWRQLDGIAGGPWFLGERFSALDLYVTAMTRWRPGRQWFAKECPRLSAIAASLDDHPKLKKVWGENFD